ncbi:HDOD domain-containing protein [Litoribacillus peritrichatus]|uniref:HDOD domain-containing protein n=1 Tax=Litoribacillus peritrichatus TaxID=718191 RepID=A0ABP7NEE8_9GAMM
MPSKELSEDQIKHVLQGIRIPPQPQIMVDLQMEQAMPDPDISRIADLISKDVGLAGTILKIVNSPFFGLSNKITSVGQAVNLLSFNSVINIVNGLTIRSEMSDEDIVALNRFWDSANDISMVAATIAKEIGYKHHDEAYLLGLFHNCGIPLMMKRFGVEDYSNTMTAAYGADSERIIDIENDKYNTNHAVVGYYTAKAWNMPTHLCAAIAEHHNLKQLFIDPEGIDSEKKNLIAILKLADHICASCKVLGGQSTDHEWNRYGSKILEHIGLGTYDIEDMAARFSEMGISVGDSFID